MRYNNDFAQSNVILIGLSLPIDSSAINAGLYFQTITLAAAIVIAVVTSPPLPQTHLTYDFTSLLSVSSKSNGRLCLATGSKGITETSSPAFHFLSTSVLYVLTHPLTELSPMTLYVVLNFLAQQFPFSIAYFARLNMATNIYGMQDFSSSSCNSRR